VVRGDTARRRARASWSCAFRAASTSGLSVSATSSNIAHMNDHQSPYSHMDDDRSSSPKRRKIRQKYAPKACMSRLVAPTLPAHSDGSAIAFLRAATRRYYVQLADMMLQASHAGSRSLRYVFSVPRVHGALLLFALSVLFAPAAQD
jgi:hypothetical protein